MLSTISTYLASVKTRFTDVTASDFEDDKAEVIDGLDAGSGPERLAVVEPLDTHAGVIDRHQTALKVGQLVLCQGQVGRGGDELWRLA